MPASQRIARLRANGANSLMVGNSLKAGHFVCPRFFCADRAVSDSSAIVDDMDDSKVLRGIELRYALTLYLAQHGSRTVTELIDGLTYQGFVIAGDPPKSVSDALRWERGHGRVRRLSRGVYGPLDMPRGTEHRIHKRVLALRAEARPPLDWL